MDKTEAYIKLSMIPSVGAATARKLLAKFGSPENIFAAEKCDFLGIERLGENTVDKIIASREIDVGSVLEEMDKLAATYVHIESPDYPKILKNLDDKPIGFYKIGSVNFDAPSVAIVGTRHCTVYGMSVAGKFAENFARAGVNVISGMARGIDTCAHFASIAAGGKTVAVLGCGVNVIYPPENREIYKKIIDGGGAVISEFPFSSRADRQNFPIRNRIISGLSLATIVVESDVRGGSMITARNAAEQGRDVFAIPGKIDSPASRGCHALIRDGARLATCAEDILEELALERQFEFGFSSDKNSDAPKLDLYGDEAAVAALLSISEEISADEISVAAKLSAQKCSSTLLMLELKKIAKKTAGGRWIRRI